MKPIQTIPELAMNGGPPIRTQLLPYGHQVIDDEDIRAVVDVLRSDWITTGPKVEEFEEAFAAYVGSKQAVTFSSGTAALHGAVFAADLGPGDEAITTPLTFCATSNCVLYQGSTPVFADVRPDTLTIDADEITRRLNTRTKALLPVDFGGHPADLSRILDLAAKHGLIVIEDACHALGAEHKMHRVGSLSHMTVFSFHPVKHITTGEGGMVTTNDDRLARRLRSFRSHGIETDVRSRMAAGQWFYEMTSLGYNYRLTDIGCALGLSQLKKMDSNLSVRRRIAACYNRSFQNLPGVLTPVTLPDSLPSWHLYPVRFDGSDSRLVRADYFAALRAEGIGVNVHYIPVHLHPYYRKRYGSKEGDFPIAESAYDRLISLPMSHAMTESDTEDVIAAVEKVVQHLRK